MYKAGRNDPCPCGSGKKYKKCCLRKTGVQTGREESIRQKLVQELLDLFREELPEESYEDALEFFWGDFNPAQYLEGDLIRFAEINFWEWVVYDWIDEDSGKLLIDMYIEKKKALSSDEHRILNMMKDSVISLFEVQKVIQDKELLLEDLLLDGEYDVIEKAATRSLKKWDILAARLLVVDGEFVLSGAVYPYPIKFKNDILKDIHFQYDRDLKEVPNATMMDFLKACGHYFNFYWYDLIQNPPKMQLATTDGEQMIISRAHYKFEDRAMIMEALRNVDCFEEDEHDFIWFGKRDKDGSATILGKISFSRGTMTLECNSKERLKRGKDLIRKHISGAVHKVDTYQDIDQYIDSMKDRPGPALPDDLPFDVQQQFYTQFMEKHCRGWLKKKLPVLGGKTPKQAVRSKKGKEQVKDLLKSFENSEEYNKKNERPSYDLSWLWDELGIHRE